MNAISNYAQSLLLLFTLCLCSKQCPSHTKWNFYILFHPLTFIRHAKSLILYHSIGTRCPTSGPTVNTIFSTPGQSEEVLGFGLFVHLTLRVGWEWNRQDRKISFFSFHMPLHWLLNITYLILLKKQDIVRRHQL